MSGAALCVLLPGGAAMLAAVVARSRAARWVHVAGCAATLAAALALPWTRPGAGWLGDPLALAAAVLTAAVALGGAVAGLEPAGTASGAAGEDGAVGAADEAGAAGATGAAGGGEAAGGHGATGFAPAAALALLGGVMLGLLADSVAVGWVAVAAAAGVASAAPLLRGGADPDDPRAKIRAMALPAAGALCLSLFGTVLLSAGGAGRWSVTPGPGGGGLAGGGVAGGPADGGVLALGCLLLLAGHALVAGLAPLHGWLGQAQASAPRALRVLLCAPLPGLALVTLLRAGRVAAAGAGLASVGLPGVGLAGVGLAGAGLLGLGLLSVALAGLALCRQGGGGTLRLATLLHGGLAAVAFGLGGSGAVYAGLLLLATSGLARAAFALTGAHPETGSGTAGPAPCLPAPSLPAPSLPAPSLPAPSLPVPSLPAPSLPAPASGPPPPGTQAMGRAAQDERGRDWLAVLAVLALAGVPPLALFPGEFLLLTEVLSRRPILAMPLVAGLGAAALGLLRRAEGGGAPGSGPACFAAWTLLAAATLLGLALPAEMSDGLTRIAEAFAAPA